LVTTTALRPASVSTLTYFGDLGGRTIRLFGAVADARERLLEFARATPVQATWASAGGRPFAARSATSRSARPLAASRARIGALLDREARGGVLQEHLTEAARRAARAHDRVDLARLSAEPTPSAVDRNAVLHDLAWSVASHSTFDTGTW
jgi:hypothetical protein